MNTVDSSRVLVSASSAKSLAAYLLKQGFSQDLLESRSGIELVELERPDYRIRIDDFNRLWDVAVELTKDDALGLHLGEHVNPDQMGVVGNLFFNCKTLGEALSQFERLFRLVNEGMHAEFAVEKGIACLNYSCERPEFYNRASMDRTMAVSISRAKAFIKEPLALKSACFGHSAPAYVKEYERIFNCPILFEQPC